MYVCMEKCFHKGRIFKRGDVLEPAEGEKVPVYFVEAKASDALPEEPLPRLGAKVKVKAKEFPSMRAPGKGAAGTGE